MNIIRVLLADDHTLVRAGFCRLLESIPGIQVVGEASDGRDALEMIEAKSPDMVLMDIGMTGLNGLEATARAKHDYPDVRVIILSMHADKEYVLRALRAGASGYLTKSAAPENLVTAVTKVARGGRYVSETLADLLAADVGGQQVSAPHERLSDREFEVMCAIASGKTASEIAATMHLSVKTISTYRARLLEKMGMSSNAELTHYAISNKLA